MSLQGEEELDQSEKKKLRKLKAVEESDDEEEGKEGHGAQSFAAFRTCGGHRFVDGGLPIRGIFFLFRDIPFLTYLSGYIGGLYINVSPFF